MAFLSLIKKYLSPIQHYPVSFVCITIAFMLPELPINDKSIWLKVCWTYLDTHVALCFAISYILVALTLLLSKANRLISLLFLIGVHGFVFFLALLDIFLYLNFGTHFNVCMLQLFNETNSQESSEFLDTYIFQPSFLSILKIPFGLVALEAFLYIIVYFVRKKLSLSNSLQYIRVVTYSVCGTFLTLCFCYFFIVLQTFTFDWTKNRVRIYDSQLLQQCKISSSFIYNSYQAFIQFADEGSQFEKCSLAQQSVQAEIVTALNSKIVLVIGESFNRHHSSLYGYDHATNPRLSAYDSLFVFDDVITSINVTSSSFKNFLSLASVDSPEQWYEEPLFPAIFKAAGYNVIFYSNQFVKDLNVSPNDASCGFFNLPNIEPYLFSHRNSCKYPYDEDLIDNYKLHKDSLEAGKENCLVMFHLMGQHVSPQNRFPEGRNFFKAQDYDRPELTFEQRQEIANYDNATLYNDSIVNTIIQLYETEDAIILYFADHGDEANDYRIHIGRSLLSDSITAPCLHCQLDIPFLIYPTPTFRTSHPQLVERIKAAVTQPFMTDDLPHLLLDIADIKTNKYIPSRSVINPQYNRQRRRLVNGYSFSDATDYDAICNAFGNWEIGFRLH